jgi:hypothetical protein
MRKLNLTLDDLRVESFSTAGEWDGRGTVRAHESEDIPSAYSCGGDTCGATCLSCDTECNQHSCAPSCNWHNNPTDCHWHSCIAKTCYPENCI